MSIGRKILKFMINLLLWLVIFAAAIVTVISITTKQNGVPNLLGYVPLSIQTQSMEPTIMTGDLIISQKYPEDQPVLKSGDIITFFCVEQEKKILKTHRIVEIIEKGDMVSYRTKGDNNEAIDEGTVAPGDVVAVYNGKIIPNGGSVIDFLKSGTGFFVCIVLPLLIFFLYQLYTFVSLVSQMKYEQAVRKGKTKKED